jgi:TRAP-type C4-dicarboxylate transport system permease small subunit
MIGSLAGTAVFAIPLLALLIVGLARTLHPALPQAPPTESAAARRQHAIARRGTGWRWAGVGLGVAVAYQSTTWDILGRGLMLAAPMFGLCVLIGTLIGESSIRSSSGPTRQAAVEVRLVRDYLPRRLSRAVIAAGGALFGLLTITTLSGSPDDLGRTGRSLTVTCDAMTGSSVGPWAGSFYSIPLTIVVLIGVIISIMALRRIVRRPRPEDLEGQMVVDDDPRRQAADAVIGACGILVTIPLVGVSLTTAQALANSACGPHWWAPAAWLLVGSIPVWLVLLGWSTAAVLLPRRPPPEGTQGTAPRIAR